METNEQILSEIKDVLIEVKDLNENITNLEKTIQEISLDVEIKNIDHNVYSIQSDIGSWIRESEDRLKTIVSKIEDAQFWNSFWSAITFILLLVSVIHFW